VSRLLVQDENDDEEKTIYEYCQEGDEQSVENMLKTNKIDVNKPDDTVGDEYVSSGIRTVRCTHEN
jgi:hypothetical protein